jgi:hypothetical protein
MRWDADEVDVDEEVAAVEVVPLAAKAARRLLALAATVFAPTVGTRWLTRSDNLATK